MKMIKRRLESEEFNETGIESPVVYIELKVSKSGFQETNFIFFLGILIEISKIKEKLKLAFKRFH